MLMSNTDRPARLHYLANGFRVLSPGDHVVCAVTGRRIPLEELKYWSASRQEAYADAQATAQVLAPQ
ncbi:hypothetical protein QE385_002440 [Sphingomonas sp. SORGH_AS 950]|uniref:DUF2093 domain-containing protein n=1 Tax=unclassified Sphingomonas TaxID=196159 RepID=UPI002788242B|nr:MULTISPECIES: DUF2093 domain-containing protein [unclassified Sphingomonas]MDQ1158113.1 hypothetical protein [Sphingomonas sp. SORGH_AS_0950]MDR6114005.1 hypothetical protein [Sphingomonas sp. SORGH_AS_0789]MDR6144806.1 hypothetical protein [Sphingomonas sp. SORGH_AS_0870]MDR6148635.1 hypothetical protein [Sphingomonas sp. SORGH_AS_0742]